MTSKVIFVPGWHDGAKDMLSPKHKMWFGWLSGELEKLGIEVISKDFPDPWDCRKEFWLPHIKEMGANENTVLIGHSTGSVASMRFAEENKILGSILVGTYYSDLGDPDEHVSGYFDNPWQWSDIKGNQKWIVQFHSTDDPWITNEEAHMVHKMLDTKLLKFSDRGHFGVDKPYTEFPELLDVLKEKLNLS